MSTGIGIGAALARPVARDDRAQFVADALRGAAGRAGVFVVTVPAPVVDPLEVFDSIDASAWLPPQGASWVGEGEVRTLRARGPERFAALRDRAVATFDELAHAVHPALAPHPVRMMGGFSFATGGASRGPWSAFGDARLTLPRFAYSQDDDGARLSLAVGADELADAGPLHWVSLMEARIAALARRPTQSDADGGRIRAVLHEDPEAFERRIRELCAAIDHGLFDKVVAARRSVVGLDRPLDPRTVATRLRRRFPACFTFGFRGEGAAFVGATPERLLSRRDRHVTTQALAGSVAAGPGAAEALLASGKDRDEHAFVVDAIIDRLAPLCARLTREPREVRRLPHVLHLCTPVTGELAADAHVLDLVAALHPTPAVGGVPRDAALGWIAENEPEPRGWYAGPVGWVDAAGDGDFAVALRSGLLTGRDAWLYAGAGIVRGSRPDAEWAETALKLQALLEAVRSER